MIIDPIFASQPGHDRRYSLGHLVHIAITPCSLVRFAAKRVILRRRGNILQIHLQYDGLDLEQFLTSQ